MAGVPGGPFLPSYFEVIKVIKFSENVF